MAPAAAKRDLIACPCGKCSAQHRANHTTELLNRVRVGEHFGRDLEDQTIASVQRLRAGKMPAKVRPPTKRQIVNQVRS